jgi:hypothetical protein
MNLTPYSPALPARRRQILRLADLAAALYEQIQPPNSYALGLAPDGLPIIAPLATTPALLVACDDIPSRRNLFTTIARTINVPARTSIILVTRWADMWNNIGPTVQLVRPERLGITLQRHLQSGHSHRLVVMLDSLGAGWDVEPRSLALLTRAPQFQMIATTSARRALGYRSSFGKIVIGSISSDFPTLFDLTAPTTLTTPPADGEFVFRHQSRWLTFTPATP